MTDAGVAIGAIGADGGTIAVANDAIGTDDLGGLFSLLAKAYAGQEWMLLAGLLLTVVVVGLRMLKVMDAVPPKLVPWLTVGLSVLTSVATGLKTGASAGVIVSTGVLVGVAAVGGWETAGKLVRDVIRR